VRDIEKTRYRGALFIVRQAADVKMSDVKGIIEAIDPQFKDQHYVPDWRNFPLATTTLVPILTKG
jgi:hypothetical protein